MSTCNEINNYEIDIRNTTKRDWIYSHISTSDTDIPWTNLYKPGGLQSYRYRLYTMESHLIRLGFTWIRSLVFHHCNWSKNNIVTIISAYRICGISIQNASPITNTMQQWQILKEQDQKQEDRNYNFLHSQAFEKYWKNTTSSTTIFMKKKQSI